MPIFGIYNAKGGLDLSLKAGQEGLYLNEQKTVGLLRPLSDTGGRLNTIFDGEIYNAVELRKLLLREGLVFSSESDSEVLLNAYKKWGPECLNYINGRYAFGIYDSVEQRLFLARDRLGKRPLFYAAHGDVFIFASELKAILKTGLAPSELDEEAVNNYFALGYIPAGLSIIRGVRKLPSAHFLEYDLSLREPTVAEYWDVPDFKEPRSETLAFMELESILSLSVKKRLTGNFSPLVFLSGGIDSSLVAALVRKAHEGTIKTLSLGFEGGDRESLANAALIARHIGSEHKELIIRQDLKADIEIVSGRMNEPVLNGSMLALYSLSAYAGKETVFLTGHGGDEVFGGRPVYEAALSARGMSKILLGLSWSNRFVSDTRVYKEREMKSLFTKEFSVRIDEKSPTRHRERLMGRDYDRFNRMCYGDLKSLLPYGSLAASVGPSGLVDMRCPLLDYKAVEYSFKHLPGELKRGKHLLRRLAGKYLSAEIKFSGGRKAGIPPGLLSASYIAERLMNFPPNEIIARKHLEKLYHRYKASRESPPEALMSVYLFLRWLETWK